MRIHPKRARVNPREPRAWATSDRTGFITNHERLINQRQWAGLELVKLNVLVHPREYDTPQRQLGALILPPDPPPIENARPEPYFIDEQTYRITMDGAQRYQVDGSARIESNRQGASPVIPVSPQ